MIKNSFDYSPVQIQKFFFEPKSPLSPSNKLNFFTDTIKNKQEEFLEKTLSSALKIIKEKEVESKDQLDPKFICDESTYLILAPFIKERLGALRRFNTSIFLSGSKNGNRKAIALNELLLKECCEEILLQAKKLEKSKKCSLKEAFQLLVGAIDKYDEISKWAYKNKENLSNKPPVSTFALRSALLLASSKAGEGLETWMAYTKSGKPTNKVWDFLSDWKNWIPEAQGAMAKYSETVFIKAKQLATKRPKNQIVLLKGGFGAGKTRLLSHLVKENSHGAIGPDLAKQVVRQTSEAFTHSSVHTQSSQLAFSLFDELIKKQSGTVVYDSSLYDPNDIISYLEKSKQVNKKMVILDVTRLDIARILAVLKREVNGNDPRIPPDRIISSAIKDKMYRVKCMEVILNDQEKDDKIKPEYHFYCGDSEGWNTEKVMVLTSNQTINFSTTFSKKEIENRLALESIKLSEGGDKLFLDVDEEKLKVFYQDEFNKTVHEVMKNLSLDEKKIFTTVFSQRNLNLEEKRGEIKSAADFFDSLCSKFQNVISKQDFIKAFDSLEEKTQQQFFKSLDTTKALSYLDLPLGAALMIHQKLLSDPWKSN